MVKISMRNLAIIALVCSFTVAVGAVTETKLLADIPTAYSCFGNAVDASNDRLMVGSYFDSEFGVYTGAVYAFEFDGTNWNQVQKLGPSDPTDLMWFGSSVAIDGNYALVGAIGADDDKGAVYVFEHDGTEWSEIKKLVADDGESQDFFGSSVDINGKECIVGAYWDSPNGTHSGSAYQFCGGCGSWLQEGRFIPADGEAEAEFGFSVAVNGHHIVIGAPFHGVANDGQIYYYHKEESSRNWELVQTIPASNTGGWFGRSLSIAGIDGPPIGDMRLVVGSPYHTIENGSAQVYENTKNLWEFKADIIPDFAAGPNQMEFGWSVDIDKQGNVCAGILGIENSGEKCGGLDVYSWIDSAYQLQHRLISSDGQENETNGWSVSMANERAFSGAYRRSEASVDECGVVYVFDELNLPTPEPTVTPTVTPTPSETSTPVVTPTSTPVIETGVSIEMPASDYGPGDPCACSIHVISNEPDVLNGIPLFVILDVYGTLLFAPDFSDFAHYEVDLIPGTETVVVVLPDFSWPTGAGNVEGIFWYAGMTNAAMSELLGQMDAFEFSWHE
ncbi:FG-GAP repeat protein [bacterium]|nr:FG-GAP repeat protein [bacterium]